MTSDTAGVNTCACARIEFAGAFLTVTAGKSSDGLTVAVGELPVDTAGPSKGPDGVPVGEATMASSVAALVGATSGVPVAVALSRGDVVGVGVFVGGGVWLAVGAAAVGDL